VESIISNHHQRGADELRTGAEGFGFEELPFKRFSANSACTTAWSLPFSCFETCKEDVLEEVIP